MAKRIIIVGASSGLGAALAKQQIARGHIVTLVARREKELKKIAADHNKSTMQVFAVSHDVTKTASVPKLFDKAVQDMGGLDEIWYVAGITPKTGPEEFNTEKDLLTMAININGAIAWLNPAAGYFSKQGSGKIIGISSVAGDRGRVGNPVYNTSKAALTTYLEALRNRLTRKGVHVMTVKPGFMDTESTKGMEGLFWLISADKAADIIIKAAAKGKQVIYVPARWRLVMLIIQHIPSFIFRRLSV